MWVRVRGTLEVGGWWGEWLAFPLVLGDTDPRGICNFPSFNFPAGEVGWWSSSQEARKHWVNFGPYSLLQPGWSLRASNPLTASCLALCPCGSLCLEHSPLHFDHCPILPSQLSTITASSRKPAWVPPPSPLHLLLALTSPWGLVSLFWDATDSYRVTFPQFSQREDWPESQAPSANSYDEHWQ